MDAANAAKKIAVEDNPQPSRMSLRGLDAANFFLADVRDGVGPFLAIYLTATHDWSPTDVGIAMSSAGFATLAAQTPMGALNDVLRQKRLLIVLASLGIAFGAVMMTLYTTLPIVIAMQALIGVAGAMVPAAIAGISLGLVGHRFLDRRAGRNEAFNHMGNVVAAALAGLLGHFIAREWIFYLVAFMAFASIVSILRVRETEIDHELARGATDEKGDKDAPKVSGFKALVTDRRLLIFAASVVLFHFGNAAMLPLVGQALAEGMDRGASLFMSAAIIVAQLVMIPVAIWAGRAAASWGRKPVFLIGFIALPIRGVLYIFSDNPVYLLAVQALDGIGAGIFGVVALTMVADLTKGTGRFNITRGAVETAIGLGASFSLLLSGLLAAAAGYDVTFLVLAGISFVALVIFWLFVPETRVLAQTDAEPEVASGPPV